MTALYFILGIFALYITVGSIVVLTMLFITGRQMMAQQQLQAPPTPAEVTAAPEAPSEPLQAGVYQSSTEEDFVQVSTPPMGGVYQAPASDELPKSAYYGSYESTQDPEQPRFGTFSSH